MAEQYTFREIQDYVSEQLRFSEERIKKHVAASIEEAKREIRASMNKSLDTKVTAAVDASMSSKGGQLIAVEAKQELTVAISKNVTKEVYGFLSKEVLPKIDAAIATVNYNNQDGDELVTEYRRRLHKVVSKPAAGTKLITGRSASAEEKLAQFQKDTLFFNDDD